jgi:molybdate transport system substrate-binding protein
MNKITGLAYLITLLLLAQPAAAVDKLLVYAAASTSNAVTEIIEQYNQENPEVQVKVSFASSSTLAKQIEAGAPAHLFISANPKWMDYLQEQKLIINESRLNLLSNKIVIVAPLGKGFKVEMNEDFDLAENLKGKLCLGDPDHVPAGIYAKQALVSLDWWDKVKTSVVGTKDVRAAVTFIERGECLAGIVYATDASASQKIDLIAEFPADSHDPIVYPVATLASAPALADTFLNYLNTSHIKSIFKKYGFTTTK